LTSTDTQKQGQFEEEILFTGQAYRNFIQAVHSPYSRGAYKNSLSLYLRYRGFNTCDQILQEDQKIAQAHLVDYTIYMREELQLSKSTINNRLAAVKKFFEKNQVDLRWKHIKDYIGNGGTRKNRKRDRPYTHLEVQRMVDAADLRGKICLLLMFTGGLRVGAITSLKIRDLEKIEKYQLYKLHVYSSDYDSSYTSYVTPECSSYIDSYLEFRSLHGERPVKEDAPLIREMFNIHDEIRAARPRAIDTQAFRRMIHMEGLKSGVIERLPVLDGRGERRAVKMTHGLRKAFQTSAINAGMAPLYSEILMGHISGGLALESYLKPSDNDLLEGNDRMIGYIGIIDALSLSDEHKLRQEVQTLRVEKSNWETMRKDLDRLEKMFNESKSHRQS
jgi:integrase